MASTPSPTLITIPTNLTDDTPIPFLCDTSYDPYVELVKYALHVVYLLLILTLNIMILRCIFLTKRETYRANSFYLVYSTDLIVGSYMCISEILIDRLFTYVTPLCAILSPYLYTPSIFFKIYFILLHYTTGFKILSQVFLSCNRMTCVVFPTIHESIWKRILKPAIVILFLLPIGIVWNIAISRVYINPADGGFSVNYIKKVSWASVSKLKLAYFIASLILIILFSSVTIYNLVVLKVRLKLAERSITIASMVVSVEFFLLAIFQVYFAFFASSTSTLRSFFISAVEYTYDSLNFLPPIVLILFNRQLSVDLGFRRRRDDVVNVKIFEFRMTEFVIPDNFSYDDPLPFECNKTVTLGRSLVIYGFQASYMILGTVLNALIIRTIFTSEKGVYRGNSFYILYTADAIVGIYINVSELFIGRLFIFITPLCPIVSPYFFTPSVFFKTYYIAAHYCSGFKTVSQIFMSFNRMTCVAMPLAHVRLWKQILRPVIIAIILLPLGLIWNILISRVYINPNGGGFSVNYKDAIPWANIALLHVIYSVVCFLFVITFFFITIFGLLMLEIRVKGVERSLTLATMVMAVQMLTFAFIQIYFAFFASSTPGIRYLLLIISMAIYDLMNVTSPLALILMSRQLRENIFSFKNNIVAVEPTGSGSTAPQNSSNPVYPIANR